MHIDGDRSLMRTINRSWFIAHAQKLPYDLRYGFCSDLGVKDRLW